MSVQQMDYPVEPASIAQAAGEPAPARPSFVDRIMHWFERLPVPYWASYLLLTILFVTVNHLLAWWDGWLPAYSFKPILLLFPWWLWMAMAIMTYLNATARVALSNFRPLLEITPEKYARLEKEFTIMPARSITLSAVFWTAVYFVFVVVAYDAIIIASGYGPVFTVFIILEGAITFFISSAIYYHTIRQLSLVNRTVKMSKPFDLFNREPVYAFSQLTARTGAAWVLMLSINPLIFPIKTAPLPVISLMILMAVLAIAAFVLPLQIVNQRLVAEKRKLLTELDQRVKATLARLHLCLEDNRLGDVDGINKAITGLNSERDLLAKLPTWPWRPGLFTGFISVLVTPIVLFLIQHFLELWLGW